MALQLKSTYIRKDTNNKQNRLSEKANNSFASPKEEIGRTPNYARNEKKDYSENPHQMEQEALVKQEPNFINANSFNEEDAMNWDNSLLDFLRVDIIEDKYSSVGTSYPVDHKCAVCTKRFSLKNDLAKHVQETHPAEKCIENNSNEINEEIYNDRKHKIYPIENKCAICDKKFSTQNELVKHTKKNHKDAKVFKCLYCKTVFSKLKSVTTHFKRIHSKLRKSFICEYCKMKFFTKFLLERHVRAHTEQRPYSCRQCDKTYKHKRNLRVHMRTHRNLKSLNVNLENNLTDDSVKHNEDLSIEDEYFENDKQNQEIIDEGSESFEQNRLNEGEPCENDEPILITDDEYCENDEQNLLNIEKHCDKDDHNLLAEYEEDDDVIITEANFNYIPNLYPYKCNECGRVYKYKKNLKYHQKKHRKNHELNETITIDDTMTDDQDNTNYYSNTYFIIDELNTDTENVDNEDVGVAGFGTGNYADEYGYEDYAPVNVENATDINQMKCGICTKVFKCQQAVAKHLQRAHPEIEFFKCPYCDDNFYSLENLSQHITIRKHLQKRNICELCLKSFDRKSDLNRHVKIHTDDRPFYCSICHKNFKQSSHLRRHQEINHSQVKKLKYTCNLCPRSFFVEGLLTRHLSTHARENEFRCTICDKAFTNNFVLQRHYETHSSRKKLICEYCFKAFKNNETFEIHIKSHVGEWKFLCTFCNETFKTKSNLINHRQSHQQS